MRSCHLAVRHFLRWHTPNPCLLLQGCTALHVAAGLGYIEVLQTLLDAGAHVHGLADGVMQTAVCMLDVPALGLQSSAYASSSI